MGPLASVRMKRNTKAGMNVTVAMTDRYFHSSLLSDSVLYPRKTMRKTLIAMASVHNTSATGNLHG